MVHSLKVLICPRMSPSPRRKLLTCIAWFHKGPVPFDKTKARQCLPSFSSYAIKEFFKIINLVEEKEVFSEVDG